MQFPDPSKIRFSVPPRIKMVILLMITLFGTDQLTASEYDRMRENMLKEIGDEVRYTASYIKKSALDERVMKAMGKVPRHEFVPEEEKDYSYDNRPLPIGHGQTISQPYIVALMTDLLEVRETDKILEVGTGSGYQAAVLAELAAEVYTIEIIEPLSNQATARFKRLKYENVHTRHGDGYYGWEEHAPFDGIVVTAAAGHIPPPLVKQLKPGGKLVVPVGGPFSTQELVLVEKSKEGKVKARQILPVSFVPLTGGEGRKSDD